MVTVDTAIKKGRIQLYWLPVCLCFIGFISLCVFEDIDAQGSFWLRACVIAGYICTFVLPAFYYLLMLPRWRIWALSNVRNVHELKQRANLSHLYPESHSFVWRLAIKSARQVAILEELQHKFNEPDVFSDDHAIPFQTEYFISKSNKLFFLIFAIASLIAAIIFLEESNVFAGLIVMLGAIFSGVIWLRLYKQNSLVLTISNDGIITNQYGTHLWSNIRNEHIFRDDSSDGSYYALSYVVNNQHIEISLQMLSNSACLDLDHALRIYRGRFHTQHR